MTGMKNDRDGFLANSGQIISTAAHAPGAQGGNHDVKKTSMKNKVNGILLKCPLLVPCSPSVPLSYHSILFQKMRNDVPCTTLVPLCVFDSLQETGMGQKIRKS